MEIRLSSKNRERPGWDKTWMDIATTIGQRSLCIRAKVGAVIVTKDNKPDSLSYNGPPPGFKTNELPCDTWCHRGMSNDSAPVTEGYSNCPSIHAESNALLRADHSSIRHGTIYVSSAICLDCAKLIAGSGLIRAVHVVRLEEKHRDPDRTEAFLMNCGISVTRWSNEQSAFTSHPGVRGLRGESE